MDKSLIEFWQARPELLRRAIQSCRDAYQRVPKGAKRLRDAGCLVGESKGGMALFGVVVIKATNPDEALAHLQETAARIKELSRDREARIQVFVPQDWSHEAPSSVSGVRTDWFRWVPVSEQEMRVEKLAARIIAAGDSVIVRLLGHLAWWKQALRDSTSVETPYRKALLVYNAATLLEWHFTAPGKDVREHFRDAKTRKRAAKAIGELIAAAHTCVAKIEGVTGTKAKRQLAKLEDAVGRAVTKLEWLYALQAIPGRVAEFEKPIKPAVLISDWLAANKSSTGTGRDASRALGGVSNGEYVVQSLLPAFAADKLFDEGKLTAADYTTVRQTCVGFLEEAIAITAENSKSKSRQRWRQVGWPAIEALSRPVAPRSGQRES